MSYQLKSGLSLDFFGPHKNDLEQPFKIALHDWFDPNLLSTIHKAVLHELTLSHEMPTRLYEYRFQRECVLPKWTTSKKDHADWEHSDQNNDTIETGEVNHGWTGRLPVRLERYYHSWLLPYGWEWPKNLAEIIGNVARKHIPKSRELWCAWNTTLDWKAGEYQDAESCFWTSRNPARDVLRREGTLALLATKDPPDPHTQSGLGRVWVYPHASGPMIFNAYGLPLITWATIFAQRYDCSYHSIGLSNGDEDGLIYVNGEHGFHLLAPETYQPPRRSYQFNFEYEQYATCNACRIAFWKADLSYHAGHAFCPKCRAKLELVDCAHCGKECALPYDAYQVDGGAYYCIVCFETCPVCPECHSTQLPFEKEGMPCSNCEREALPCQNCGTGISYSELRIVIAHPDSRFRIGLRREDKRIRFCRSCIRTYIQDVKCPVTWDYYLQDIREICVGCGAEGAHQHGKS